MVRASSLEPFWGGGAGEGCAPLSGISNWLLTAAESPLSSWPPWVCGRGAVGMAGAPGEAIFDGWASANGGEVGSVFTYTVCLLIYTRRWLSLSASLPRFLFYCRFVLPLPFACSLQKVAGLTLEAGLACQGRAPEREKGTPLGFCPAINAAGGCLGGPLDPVQNPNGLSLTLLDLDGCRGTAAWVKLPEQSQSNVTRSCIWLRSLF